MNSKQYGSAGEILAQNYLKKHHYKILECNYTTKLGEIDIIAMHKKTIVFVEVKSRTSKEFGLPREAVTDYKQNKIRQVAAMYLQKTKNFDTKCRFDVIEVFGEDINHIEDAFI